MPVLILGPVPPEGLEDALAAKAELALWSTGDFARRLCKAARNRQCAAAVHVKVNTDLNRLGFEPHELTDAVEEFLRLPELSIAGIFSHLASAEELNAGYTMHQLGTFERALAGVKPLLERREMNALAHIAASAAAMLWPQTRLDLARFGIALYGLMPSPQTREALTPPLDLRPGALVSLEDRRGTHDCRRRVGRLRRKLSRPARYAHRRRPGRLRRRDSARALQPRRLRRRRCALSDRRARRDEHDRDRSHPSAQRARRLERNADRQRGELRRSPPTIGRSGAKRSTTRSLRASRPSCPGRLPKKVKRPRRLPRRGRACRYTARSPRCTSQRWPEPSV